MKLLFTESAQRDLIRLREFIAEKNPTAATRISRRLRQSILRITDQPEMGVNIEELPGVQDLVSGDYVVRYTVMDREIYILRIWHDKDNR